MVVNYFKTVCVIMCLCVLCSSLDSMDWLDELFGDGLSEQKLAEKSRKHLSSSTEDLLILLNTEERLLQRLNTENNKTDLIKSYIKSVDYTENDDLQEYVYHPINAFHLMKRASNFWPKVKKHLEDTSDVTITKQEIIFPEKSDFIKGASFGLVNLQIMHKLNTSEMIKGILRNPSTGTIYQSKQNLSSDDALLLASTSKSIFRLNSQVDWLEAALEAAKAEQRSEKQIVKFEKLINKAKQNHDEMIFNKGFMRTMNDKEILFTLDRTYNKEMMDSYNLKVHLAELDKVRKEMELYKNLRGLEDLPFKLGYITDTFNQKLCSDEQIRPLEMNTNLKCINLHYGNPYLRLGPFKYEPLNEEPHVGRFVDFASSKELSIIRERARGHMKSTPLRTNNDVHDYTRHRTSKVMYLNEHQTQSTRSLSDRIDLATKFKTYAEKFASENYQVMNYGIGGSIVGHLDSIGQMDEPDKQENLRYGGPRFCTFMVYLTDVEAGGRTVFPTIGVSVAPKLGDALFWFNLDSGGVLDSRNFHLGCPVIYGNKWIANKWIHWIPQMWNYQCQLKGKPFPIYKN